MMQIAKSILLNVPVNVAYEAIKNLVTSRFTTDLIGPKGTWRQDVSNTIWLTKPE